MDQFIGVTVKVTLRHPPNGIVFGIVHNMVPNDHITLRDVVFPQNGNRLDHFTLQVSVVADIEVVEPNANPGAPSTLPAPSHPPAQPFHQYEQQLSNNPPQPPQPHTHAHPVSRPAATISQPPQNVSATPQKQSQQQQQQTSVFVDPAILHYGTSPPVPKRSAPTSNDMQTPVKSMLSRAAQNLPSPSSPFIADVGRANVAQKLAAAARQTSSSAVPQQQTVKKPTPMQSSEQPQQVAQIEPTADSGTKKKAKKSKRKDVADPPPVMNTEVSRNGNDMNGAPKRGKGWRNTPFLQPTPQPGSPSGTANTKKSRKKQGREEEFAQGDTTDIQEAGDFDFEGELKKFDKKQVFDEIRQGDTTADEDRLVSHNRIHRPGTHGGKNLHPTEPVLSPKLAAKNDLDSSSDADTELNFQNGRSTSRHSVTRSILSKKQPARQNSQHIDSKPYPHPLHTLSTSVSNRSTSSLVSRSKQAPSLTGASPRPDRSSTPPMARSVAKGSASQAPYFAIQPEMSFCPTLLPGGLEALESAAIQTFGVSADAITESAALHIAQAAISLSEDSSFRRPSRSGTLRGSISGSAILDQQPPPETPPVIVVLAGNHAIGARALAAARHLLSRNYHIISAETIYDEVENVNPQRRAQVSILRRMRGGGASIKRGRWHRASGYIKQLPAPPAVIVDALLAGATYESLTNDAGKVEVREMIDWANRSRAPVLSIGCPSGVDGSSGATTIVEGEPLAVRPAKVLALGAPMQGVLNATQGGELKSRVLVADIGTNIALRSDEAVAFGPRWSVGLEYMDHGEVERGRT